MPILPRRTRLIGLATALAVAVGLLLILLSRPASQTEAGSLDQPSALPSVPAPLSPPAGTPPPEPEVLLAVGDVASCDASADEAVAQLAARLPGTIAMLGDTVYEDGSAADYRACFEPAWGPMRSRIRPALGNHEYHTEDAAGYFAYFGDAAGPAGRGWYSYDLGGWHVVVLNSNCREVGCDASSAQVAWLRADLARDHGECVLAYWHEPRWSSGFHGSSDDVDLFWELLGDAGADVVLNGHDHTYERISVEGMRQFVVGTGGRFLHAFRNPPLPETEVRSDANYGLLWLALGDRTYDWEFLALGDSGFTDSGSGDC